MKLFIFVGSFLLGLGAHAASILIQASGTYSGLANGCPATTNEMIASATKKMWEEGTAKCQGAGGVLDPNRIERHKITEGCFPGTPHSHEKKFVNSTAILFCDVH